MRNVSIGLLGLLIVSLAGCCCARTSCNDVAGFSRAPDGRIEPAGVTEPQVLIESHCLMVKTPNFLSDLGAEDSIRAPLRLDDKQVEIILRAVQKSDRVELLAMPSIVTLHGDEATVEVAEGEGTRNGGSSRMLHGHRLEFTPTIDPDTGRVHLKMFARHRARPAKGVKSNLVETVSEIDQEFTLGDRETVMITALDASSTRSFAILVKATILMPEGEASDG